MAHLGDNRPGGDQRSGGLGEKSSAALVVGIAAIKLSHQWAGIHQHRLARGCRAHARSLACCCRSFCLSRAA
jgi:hypothetical protein